MERIAKAAIGRRLLRTLATAIVLTFVAEVLFAGTATAAGATTHSTAKKRMTAKTPSGTIHTMKPTFRWTRTKGKVKRHWLRIYVGGNGASSGDMVFETKFNGSEAEWTPRSALPVPTDVDLVWKVKARHWVEWGMFGGGNWAWTEWSRTQTFKVVLPKAITAFSFQGLAPPVVGAINEAAHTVALMVPLGTSVKALVPTITITGTSVSPASGVARDFTSPVTYTVTAADGSKQAYVVTVTFPVAPPNLAKAITAFSFQGLAPPVTGAINEAAHTIALTVPSGTNLTALVPTIAITGTSVSPASGVARDFTNPVTYTVFAANATTQTYVVTVTVAAPPPSSAKAITAFSFQGLAPPVVGTIDEVAHTIALTVPSGTKLTALVPTITITGNSVSPASGVAQNFTDPATYTVTAADGTTQTYVVTVSVAPSSAKAITAFTFQGLSPAVNGTIDEAAHTVTLTVPFGTSVTALVPTIAITGSSVSPASGVAANFTNPVAYTVTAANGTTQAYIVTVAVAPPPPSSTKAITAFSFQGLSPAVAGTINEAAHTVALTVPSGTNITALVPTITITGVSVNPASGVAQNFTNPVTYTVTAADSSTQTYVVTVTVATQVSVHIDAVNPNHGVPGAQVTVTGSDFGPNGGGGGVLFGTRTFSGTFAGTPGTVISWSDTQIVCLVPAVNPKAMAICVKRMVFSLILYSNDLPFTVDSPPV